MHKFAKRVHNLLFLSSFKPQPKKMENATTGWIPIKESPNDEFITSTDTGICLIAGKGLPTSMLVISEDSQIDWDVYVKAGYTDILFVDEPVYEQDLENPTE